MKKVLNLGIKSIKLYYISSKQGTSVTVINFRSFEERIKTKMFSDVRRSQISPFSAQPAIRSVSFLEFKSSQENYYYV